VLKREKKTPREGCLRLFFLLSRSLWASCVGSWPTTFNKERKGRRNEPEKRYLSCLWALIFSFVSPKTDNAWLIDLKDLRYNLFLFIFLLFHYISWAIFEKELILKAQDKEEQIIKREYERN